MNEARQHLWVNVYEIDCVYGGPEEGGWWYDTGDPVHDKCIDLGEVTKAEAFEVAERVACFQPIPSHNVSSILYSGGQFDVIVEDHEARPFPSERPFYE